MIFLSLQNFFFLQWIILLCPHCIPKNIWHQPTSLFLRRFLTVKTLLNDWIKKHSAISDICTRIEFELEHIFIVIVTSTKKLGFPSWRLNIKRPHKNLAPAHFFSVPQTSRR